MEHSPQAGDSFLGEIQEGFEEFWELYPNKQAKPNAVAAYARLHPNEELRKKMLEALKKQCACPAWQREGGRYIPYPAKWIVERRWEDEVPEKQEKTCGHTREWTVSAQDYDQRDYSNADQEMMDYFIRMNTGETPVTDG